MRKSKSRQRVSFEDGSLRLYEVVASKLTSDIPKKMLRQAGYLHYEERSVGAKRYWSAKREGYEVSRVVRVLRRPNIWPGMVVVLTDGEQYDIVTASPVMAVDPPCMELTLTRRTDRYPAEVRDDL